MSGGYFDYDQYKIADIADEIRRLINNIEKGQNIDKYDGLHETVLLTYKEALDTLESASIFVQRIDWLESDDDSAQTYLERLRDDMTKYLESKK